MADNKKTERKKGKVIPLRKPRLPTEAEMEWRFSDYIQDFSMPGYRAWSGMQGEEHITKKTENEFYDVSVTRKRGSVSACVSYVVLDGNKGKHVLEAYFHKPTLGRPVINIAYDSASQDDIGNVVNFLSQLTRGVMGREEVESSGRAKYPIYRLREGEVLAKQLELYGQARVAKTIQKP